MKTDLIKLLDICKELVEERTSDEALAQYTESYKCFAELINYLDDDQIQTFFGKVSIKNGFNGKVEELNAGLKQMEDSDIWDKLDFKMRRGVTLFARTRGILKSTLEEEICHITDKVKA
ncbi:hypothetical protein [Thermoactinomyces sp. DSM 45892]|uniref:hypothetical protein n=1 Tax=Thermoactinomyces sp. DSM 45892 TaxID=1882753 RepID=UPI00089D66D7|nr:hypothetical protein [Thermoactinomyces sp. DSM 45892]SDX94227.1 hypothetical protein SAMN05444416_10165 [Thermoactinomyces sp. DSM 45892]